jgi:hypothetical protein
MSTRDGDFVIWTAKLRVRMRWVSACVVLLIDRGEHTESGRHASTRSETVRHDDSFNPSIAHQHYRSSGSAADTEL